MTNDVKKAEKRPARSKAQFKWILNKNGLSLNDYQRLVSLEYPEFLNMVRQAVAGETTEFEFMTLIARDDVQPGWRVQKPESDPFRRIMYSRVAQFYLAHYIAHSTDEEFSKWFRIKGFEHLQTAQEAENNVCIMVDHSGAYRMIPYMLARFGLPIVLIAGRDLREEIGISNLENIKAVLSIALTSHVTIIRQAKRLISQRNIIATAIDGKAGTSGKHYQTADGPRPYRQGFSLYCNDPKTVILPTFTKIDDKGVLHLQINSPLPRYEAGQDRSEFADLVITEYLSRFQTS